MKITIRLLRKAQQGKRHEFGKKDSEIWRDIVYRQLTSEVRSPNGKLIEYGRRAEAAVGFDERMCRMTYEMGSGERRLGFHSGHELEHRLEKSGKVLP